NAARTEARAAAARRPIVSREGAGGDEGMARADAKPCEPGRGPDEAAGRRQRVERVAGGRRNHLDRLGHDHHVGRALYPDQARTVVLLLRQPRNDGAWAAVYD